MTTSPEDNTRLADTLDLADKSGSVPSSLHFADILWDDSGEPVSRTFGDIYFSSASGIDESHHVFIQHNQLLQRWQTLASVAVFTIAETGFGSGLNFLVAWQAWQQSAPQGATLHFISVEKYPMRPADLSQALALWPSLTALSKRLIDHYPPVDARGFHRLVFDQVHLTLIFDDAGAGLAQLLPIEIAGPNVNAMDCGWAGFSRPNCGVDAWFLDGFSPAKNPQMWSEQLFETMARLSHKGSTFATFTSAGLVRRGLQSAGFEVRKTPGFGPKRDMTCGIYLGSDQVTTKPSAIHCARPRPSSSWHLSRRENPLPQQIAVIGAGLAGCQSAYALAQQGFSVTVIDREDIAAGASGNPLGIVYSKLSSCPGVLGDFNIAALSFALRFYRQAGLFERCGDACGVLQLAENEQAVSQGQSLAQKFGQSHALIHWLNREQASAATGITLEHGGLWLPQAGWINPALLCQTLLRHRNIQVLTHRQVKDLTYADQQWHLTDDAGTLIHSAPAVVIACADSASHFAQCAHLPTKRLRGQISYASSNQQSQNLNAVLCGHSYIAPAHHGSHVLGASFNLNVQTLENRWSEHQENLQQVKTLAPALQDLEVTHINHGRASFRCTTPDYLPMIGPAPHFADMLGRYAAYRTNSKARVDAPGAYWPGLFINLGHGSKGLAYTPLCAQLLASMIGNQPLPLARNLTQHLHSARFLMRDIARSKV